MYFIILIVVTFLNLAQVSYIPHRKRIVVFFLYLYQLYPFFIIMNPQKKTEQNLGASISIVSVFLYESTKENRTKVRVTLVNVPPWSLP